MTIGHLYILFNPALRSNQFKIGKTTRDPKIRALELSQATGVPQPYEVLFTQPVGNCEIAERLVHSRLARYRRYQNREFFNLPLERAIEAVREAGEMTEMLTDEGLFDDPSHPGRQPLRTGRNSSEVTFGSAGHCDPQENESKDSIGFRDQLSRTSESGQIVLLELRNRIRQAGPDISEHTLRGGHITYARRPDRVFVELIVKTDFIQALFLQLDLETNKSLAVKFNKTAIGEKSRYLHKLRNPADVEKIAPIIEMSYHKAR